MRILIFLDPGMDPQRAGYQIIQSIISIGSGGLFGKGFLDGSQSRLEYLPVRHTDFVFSVLVSLLTYNYEVHLLKEERDLNKQSKKKTSFHSGLLTLMFLIVFAIAFLHWYRVIPMVWRMGLLLTVVIAYVAVLFRAVNTLFYIRLQSSKK